MSIWLHAERSMSLEWRAARSNSLAWTNPVAWWWGLLTLVSGVNIAVWFWLYHQLHQPPAGGLGSTIGIEVMLLLCAVAFFIAGIGLCRLLPEFDGEVRVILVVTIIGIAGYLAFLMTVDVPMYLNRWRTEVGDGSRLMKPLEGLRDVSTRWVVTHDLAEWKEEIAWMSLYFSAAVWASLALCVCYSLEQHLPRYRTEPAVASWSSDAGPPVSKAAAMVRGRF